MSDFIPNPDAGNESDEAKPFDFSALNAETTEPLSPHTAPNPDSSGKVPWWKSGKKRDSKAKKEPKAAPAMPRGGLRQSLETFYVGVGMAVMAVDTHCGQTILDNAESCAKAMDELAKTNPAVRRVLMKLLATSALGTVIGVHAPIAMAIAMHHIPALRERQEKMVGDFAEMMANGKFGETPGGHPE